MSVLTVDRSPAADLAARIEAAAARLASDPASAEHVARQALAAAPNDPRAVLILASARRRLGAPREALALLEPLAAAYPRAAHTQYELGRTRVDLGDTEAAIIALRLATALKPDLAEAWRALGDCLFRQGDAAGAALAFAQHDRASIRDPQLKPAADDLFNGRLDQAEARLRAHLVARPTDASAINLLADVFLRQSRYSDAETLLAQALRIDPEFDGARFNYATALFRQQKAVEAIAQIEALLPRHPRSAPYRNLLAACLGLVGDDARVAELHQTLLEDFPNQPDIWLNHAHALRTVGCGEEALAAYRRCIALAPGMGGAYWGLANLKVASFSAEEIAAMRVQLARTDISDDDRLHLHFALGKALEDQPDESGAFTHYAEGGRLRRAQVGYDAQRTTALLATQRSVSTPALFARRRGCGSPSNAPIFIVGLPRSGSTLVEQILASHSDVEGTAELPELGFIAQELDRDGGYPACITELDGGQLKALGEVYLERTRIHRKLGRPFFIDKMPNNFQHVGLLQLILPHAKIIDVRRHPMGACFSAFKQLFAQGQSFSYDLDDLGRYYADYVVLMAHFDAVLPGRVHRVIYEDLVEDTESEVRRLLAYCGLPFEDACLRFFETERAVRTVSSEQVRRPIFREGLDRWRRFEPWLGPLEQALGPVLETWRGVPGAHPPSALPTNEVAHAAQSS